MFPPTGYRLARIAGSAMCMVKIVRSLFSARRVAATFVGGLLLAGCSRSTCPETKENSDDNGRTQALGGKNILDDLCRSDVSVACRKPSSPVQSHLADAAAGMSDNSACLQIAIGQAQLNDCASDMARGAERSMERIVDKILNLHTSDPVFIRKFTAAQMAWLRYRDAELAARFPAENSQAEYGSMFPTCWGLEHARLSHERIRSLKPWIEPSQGESETCQGSY
jgi:uncharacterized protein YecT (DUF1311 family)